MPADPLTDELLFRAISTPLGIIIETSDVVVFKRKFYSARKRLGGDYLALRCLTSAFDPGQLILTSWKKPSVNLESSTDENHNKEAG